MRLCPISPAAAVTLLLWPLLLLGACTPPFTTGDAIDPDLAPKAAVLVLDMQKDFLSPDGAFPVDTAQGDAALAATNTMLEGLPIDADVVYAKNDFAPEDISNPFRGNSAIAGSEGAELDDRLLLLDDAPLFSKQESDAFSNDDFDAYLRDAEVTHVVLSGVYADGCVYATALAAQQRGYDVTILTDAVATADDDRLAAAFDAHRRQGFALDVTANIDDLLASP